VDLSRCRRERDPMGDSRVIETRRGRLVSNFIRPCRSVEPKLVASIGTLTAEFLAGRIPLTERLPYVHR
jgi:hypothetical protein